MNKVLLVGELVSNVVLQSTKQGSINSFIIATVRVPKDSRKQKELHFIYCKAFGKTIPNILAQTEIGDILSVSGQLATTVHDVEGKDKEYRMEVWAENVKPLPERIRNQTNIHQASKSIEHAIRSYGNWDHIGQKVVHTLEVKKHDLLQPIKEALDESQHTDKNYDENVREEKDELVLQP